MKLHSNRIVMKQVSLSEAVKKASEAPKARSLEQLLQDMKQSKLAASAAPVIKTASTETPAEVAPAAAAPAPVEAAAAPVAKVAETKVAEKEEEVEVVELKGDEKPWEKKEEKKEEEKKEEKEASTAPVTLKVASKLDFRSWNGEDVVKAWEQHGTMANCVKNVGSAVSDPKLYCGLLQTASKSAASIMQKAAASKTETKTASQDGRFVKVSKLDDKSKSLLAKYFAKIYGQDYVDALLEDY